jgi:hypothetical protein
MKISNGLIVMTLLITSFILPTFAFPVTVGQIDTFEDGTTQNWLVGLLGNPHPAPPANVPTGGPTGLDDNYMLLTALGGQGAGSRLTVINLTQWTGDFVSAGINAIQMDLNNFGSTDFSLRLLFSDPAVGPPSNLAFSAAAIFLPAGSGWTSVVFPITPADLSAGLGSVISVLTDATEMRIFHNPAAAFPPSSVQAILGVDNIEALSVAPIPEPTTMLLLGSGLIGLAGYARKKFFKK